MKFILITLLTATPALFGQEAALELDPAQTQVRFTLPDILHTVHGAFHLKRGAVRYDFATGKSSGEIVIDARSGDTGSEARDQRMHKNILESDRYPEIVFLPDHVEGDLSKAMVHGTFRIHGQDHEMTMAVAAVPAGGRVEVATQFIIPYVQWGMKNPSTLFLRVGDKVTVEIQAKGRITSESTGSR